MGYAVEVNTENFNTEVIETSYEKLVLVDFFATWCGPCQILKPMLEKLVQEYDFVLAKVDIDQSPQLASTYGIEGVPDVRIVNQGEILPGFVGALPEAELRSLLVQLNLKSELEMGLEEIHTAIARENLPQAQSLLEALLQRYPNRPQLTLQAAQLWFDFNQIEQANQLLDQILPAQREYYAKAQALKQLITLKAEAEHPGTSELDGQYAQACGLTLARNYEAALAQFLEIVSSSRNYKNDAARKAMLTIFQLLGDDHALTQKYRKQLMLQLY